MPLNQHETILHLAKKFNFPIILVVGVKLGCINHALLTAQAIKASGLRLAGWVANTVDTDMKFFEENVQALKQRLDAPCLAVMPRLAVNEIEQASQYLDLNLLK